MNKGLKETPIIITGDFNAMPDSAMYELYSTGKVSATHIDFRKQQEQDLSHNLSLNSAYKYLNEPITNYTRNFKG